MNAVDTETIERDGREYVIEVHADLDGANPFEDFDYATTLALSGGREYNDAIYGPLSDVVLDAINKGHSNAAIARWLNLVGATGVTLVARGGNYGSISTRPVEYADTDHELNVWREPGAIYRTVGFAFLAPGVSDREVIPNPDAYVAAEVSDYAAWAEGSIYGWIVTDESGRELDACWGYYGWDHDASGLMEAATAAVDAHEADLSDQASVAGAGFVGVI